MYLFILLFLEFTSDQTLIPKNTSLIVSRIPLTSQQKKAWYVFNIVVISSICMQNLNFMFM